MRAWLFALLLLLPAMVAAAGSAPTRDVIVLLERGASLSPMPQGAVPLAITNAIVVPHADGALQVWLAARPGVAAVVPAVELQRTADPNLQLTRAEPAPTDDVGVALTGHGVTVAVVDSGIDATHPDLTGRVLTNVKLVGGSFVSSVGDTNGHGTHVAGIVAGSGASTQGKVRGVAPGASLVGIDISDRFTTASALLAYDWLYLHRDDYGIRVVVNAWGRTGEGEAFDPNDPEIRAIDRLVDAGVVVLFSASNHGPDARTLSVEAMDPRVITVGAVDSAAQLAPYSSRGPVVARDPSASWVKPDVVAPGDTILGLKSQQAPLDANSDPDALHRYYSGTSQAVPHVAGIVALMLEANASLRPTQVQNDLRAAAIDLGAPGPDDSTGFGLVDAKDAVRLAMGETMDRKNVLVAGGDDRFEDGARLDAGASRGGLLGLVSAPPGAWTTTFPVKEGARQLTFDLQWSVPVGTVSVELDRDGRTMGTWSDSTTEAGSVVVRGRLDAPQPGVWTLRASGAAPVPVQVTSTADITLKANPARSVELDSRYRLPDTPSSAASSLAHGQLETALVQGELFAAAHPAVLPALLAGFLGGIMLVGIVRRPRRHVVREIVLEDA